MATFNFHLRSRKATKETQVHFVIWWKDKKFVYNTQIKVLPKCWDSGKQRTKRNYVHSPETNRRLEDFMKIGKNAFIKLVNDTGKENPELSEVREAMDVAFNRKGGIKPLNLFEFIETHIERSKQALISKGKFHGRTTIVSSYNQTLRLLKEYDKKLTYESIDLDFYYSFIEFCENEKLYKANNIGKHIKNLKAFLNEATEQGYNTNLAFRSKRFIKPQEDVTNIYLTREELDEIAKDSFNDRPGLIPAKDLFLIGCYTGLRFSDFSVLTKANIQDGHIKIKTQKTEHPVIIPILPIVKEILERYNYQLPEISNPNMNKNLKEIAKRVDSLHEVQTVTETKAGKQVVKNFKKWEMVQTHTARRSFATNSYKMGIPSISIMAITGHKTERAFLNYIKVTPNEHAAIVLSYWNRAQMSAS